MSYEWGQTKVNSDSKTCKCKISNRGAYPMDDEDSLSMCMRSVSTLNGFFRVCTLCDKPLYLRNKKGPYDK